MTTYTKALIPFAKRMRREMTRAELKLWLDFLRDHVPRVRRQRPFGGYIVDFYCVACKVVIEVDGSQHFTPEGLAYDAERTVFLEALGLRVVRFSNADVIDNFEEVCSSLRALLVQGVV
jgi:very-short-patch-repair endonuclease